MEPPKKLFNRNFLLQYQGQTVSRLGTQGFMIASLFWIKHATGSASIMGLVSMLSSLPGVILSPVGGTIADRYSRRKIIIFSDLFRGLSVLTLVGLLYFKPDATELILTWVIFISLFKSFVNAIFSPTIQATIPDLVPQDKVQAANSLGQLSMQLSVFFGQGLGGTLYRLLGPQLLFLVDGLSYLYASFSESFAVIPQNIPDKSGDVKQQFREFLRDIGDGLKYVWKKDGLREAVFISAILAFFTTPFGILLPFYVEDVLNVTTDWYGYFLAVMGIGTLAGYIFAGVTNPSGKKRSQIMLVFINLEALGYGYLGLNRSPVMALVFAFLGGFVGGYVMIGITTILQLTTPGEIRGRVFGLLTSISGSLSPIAMGLSGIVADLLDQNIPLIYVSCGVIMVVLAVWATLNAKFRRFLESDGSGGIPGRMEEQPVPLN